MEQPVTVCVAHQTLSRGVPSLFVERFEDKEQQVGCWNSLFVWKYFQDRKYFFPDWLILVRLEFVSVCGKRISTKD